MSDLQTGKPDVYVSAFFCDRVLREHDGVLSAIRIVDLFSAPAPEEGAAPFIPRLETNLIIILRSESRAEVTVTIRAKDPLGAVKAASDAVSLEGEAGAYVCTMAIAISIASVPEGTRWYDILVNDVLASRIPLRVKLVKVPTSRGLTQTWKSPEQEPRS